MNNREVVYSGEKLKEFLTKNRITYLEASEALNIDKNTIGKAVRGGNLNLSIILKICNTYGFKPADFFSFANIDGNDVDSDANVNYSENNSSSYSYAAEDDNEYLPISEYEKIEILENLLTSKDVEISLLRETLKAYQERLEAVESVILNK